MGLKKEAVEMKLNLRLRDQNALRKILVFDSKLSSPKYRNICGWDSVTDLAIPRHTETPVLQTQLEGS